MAKSRQNGERSRRAVLARALALTAEGGRETATIAALASGLGMSKAGVFALFGSKHALDEAMVETAAERFGLAVLGPAGAAPAGLARLAALCEGFLLFAISDGALTAAHPGFGGRVGRRASARLAAWAQAWQRALESAAADALSRGECRTDAEPAQVAFELAALLDGAAARLARHPHAEVLARTRAAVDRMLVSWSAA